MTPMSAPTTPIAAMAPIMPPTKAAECGEELELRELPPLALFALDAPADPLALASSMLGGKTLAADVGWAPNCPFPTITKVPLLGIPFMVTNKNAGPGWKILGFGSAWAT